jgi:hypothetical protein
MGLNPTLLLRLLRYSSSRVSITAIIACILVIYSTADICCNLYYMIGLPEPAKPYGLPAGGVRQSDVSHAADTLLRLGVRPTVEKVRAKLGRGSPNTINPMLDAWWKTLSARLDSGPAALHRIPETVAHIAEALWMQALEEGKRRATLEQRDSARLTELDKQRLEVRSHVLTLREGELDSRLRDRDRTIEELNLRLRELTGALRKEQATHELLAKRLSHPAPQILARGQPPMKASKARTPLARKRKRTARRAAPLRNSTKRNMRKQVKRRISKRGKR